MFAEYKIRTGKKVLDPERERQKLEVLRGKAHGEFNQLGAQELFSADHGDQQKETVSVTDKMELKTIQKIIRW